MKKKIYFQLNYFALNALYTCVRIWSYQNRLTYPKRFHSLHNIKYKFHLKIYAVSLRAFVARASDLCWPAHTMERKYYLDLALNNEASEWCICFVCCVHCANISEGIQQSTAHSTQHKTARGGEIFTCVWWLVYNK